MKTHDYQSTLYQLQVLRSSASSGLSRPVHLNSWNIFGIICNYFSYQPRTYQIGRLILWWNAKWEMRDAQHRAFLMTLPWGYSGSKHLIMRWFLLWLDPHLFSYISGHNFHSEGRPRSASKWKLPSQIPSAQSFSEQFQRPCMHIVPTSCPWPIFWPVSVSSLFGITVVQVYTYYHNFPKDWKLQKYVVCLYNPGHIRATLILTLRSQVALLLYLSKVYSILCLTLHRLLDIFHAVFTIVAIYHYLIDEFGDIGAVQYLSW